METTFKRKRKKTVFSSKNCINFEPVIRIRINQKLQNAYVGFKMCFRVCVNYLKTRKCLRFKIQKLLKIFISDLTYKMCLKKTSRTQVNASGKFPSKMSSVYEFNTSLKNSILIFSKTVLFQGAKIKISYLMPTHFSKQLSLLGRMNLE